MILIGGALLVATLFRPFQQQNPSQDPAPSVRRVAATAQLAAQEYRLGVVNGRVVAPAEVAEARLFLGESRRSAELLPERSRRETLLGVDSLIRLVDQRAAPAAVDAGVKQLITALSKGYGVALDEVPSSAPSLARGASVYQNNCSGCHGEQGLGNGPMAQALDPKPADLADAPALRNTSRLLPQDQHRGGGHLDAGIRVSPFPGRPLGRSALRESTAPPPTGRFGTFRPAAVSLQRENVGRAGPRGAGR